MAKSSLETVARGVLIDALITYVAICKEKGYDGDPLVRALHSWREMCHEHVLNIDNSGPSNLREGKLFDLLVGDDIADDEHLEVLIAERRGLIRDSMRAELEALDDADAGASESGDREVSREVESREDGSWF